MSLHLIPARGLLTLRKYIIAPIIAIVPSISYASLWRQEHAKNM